MPIEAVGHRYALDVLQLCIGGLGYLTAYLSHATVVNADALREAAAAVATAPPAGGDSHSARLHAASAAVGAGVSAGVLPPAWEQLMWRVVLAVPAEGGARWLYVLRNLPALTAHSALVLADGGVVPVLVSWAAMALLITVGKRWYLRSPRLRSAALVTFRCVIALSPLVEVAAWLPARAAAAAAAGSGPLAAFLSSSVQQHARLVTRVYGGQWAALTVVLSLVNGLCYGVGLAANLLCSAALVLSSAPARHMLAVCYTDRHGADGASLARCVASPSHWRAYGAGDAAVAALLALSVAALHMLSGPPRGYAWRWRHGARARRTSAAAVAVGAAAPSACGDRKTGAAAAAAVKDVLPGSSSGGGGGAVDGDGSAGSSRRSSTDVVGNERADGAGAAFCGGDAPAAPRTAAVARLAARLAAAPRRSRHSKPYVSPFKSATLAFKVVLPEQHAADGAAAYQDAQARVQAAAAAALARVAARHDVRLVSTSTTTFPGCVHLLLGLQAQGACEALPQALLDAIREELPPGASIVLGAPFEWTSQEEEAPYAEPAALPAARQGAGDGDAGEAAGRLQLCLPAWLVARMGEGCGVRVVAALERGQGPAAVLLDTVFAAADVAAAAGAERPAHVALTIPTAAAEACAGAPPGSLVLLHALLRQAPLPGAADGASAPPADELLAQLPLPVLPTAAAAAELATLFRRMGAEEGDWPGDAYAAGFGDVALDLALVLRRGEASAAAGEPLFAALRALLRLLSGQPGGMPACMQLVADAAMRHGLHAASLQAARARAAAGASGAPAPRAAQQQLQDAVVAVEAAPEPKRAPAALAPSPLVAKPGGASSAGSPLADAGAALSGDARGRAPARRSPGAAAAWGYASAQLERRYRLFKAARQAPLDFVSVLLRIAIVGPLVWLVERELPDVPGGPGVHAALRGVLLLIVLPSLLQLAAPSTQRWRNALETWPHLAYIAVGGAALVASGAAPCALPVVRWYYGRPLSLIPFTYLVQPMVHNLVLPVHAACTLLRVLVDAGVLWACAATRPDLPTTLPVLLASAAAGCVGVWALDRRFRRQFEAAVGAP